MPGMGPLYLWDGRRHLRSADHGQYSSYRAIQADDCHGRSAFFLRWSVCMEQSSCISER